MAFLDEFSKRDFVMMGSAVCLGGVTLLAMKKYLQKVQKKPNLSMSSKAKFNAIPSVDIDPDGLFKYVLIKVYSGKGDEERLIVRGYRSAEWHADIYERAWESIQGLGFETECVGGGRILHEAKNKTLEVYGYSQGYGRADHNITVKLLKEHYPDYSNIFISDKPY